MPRTSGYVLSYELGARRVIEDKQPVLVRVSPIKSLDHHSSGVISLIHAKVREGELLSQGDERIDDRIFLLSPDPPNKVIIIAKAVSILGRDLRLPNPAKAIEWLGWLANHRS